MKSDNQFQHGILPAHFEIESHEQIQGLQIANFVILNGALASQDILVVLYKDSPLLSFYDVNGHLIDVDHYLPDNYVQYDNLNAEEVLKNIQGYNASEAKDSAKFNTILNRIIKAGKGDFYQGMSSKYGLSFSSDTIQNALNESVNLIDTDSLVDLLLDKFFCFSDFLEACITSSQKTSNGYVHITSNSNIIITPLNKRSGVAVIIETQNAKGELLPPNKWNIVRTKTPNSLEQALVFRTEDVKGFFSNINYETSYETERYKMYQKPGLIQIDSYVDNTDNLLQLPIINDCLQVLASDKNIIIILTNDSEITVVNTHKSVVPAKWPRKIVLPIDMVWMRVDENLSVLFAQDDDGNIIAYDITGNHPKELAKIGIFDFGFEIDQRGDLIVSQKGGSQISKIRTNVYDLNLGADLDTFTSMFKDISYLFKGENLFTKVTYAKSIAEVETDADVNKLPSAIEVARYDFETSIEHMLVNGDNSYTELLEVKNKIAIARQNIAEELTAKSEKFGVLLVGQRLNSSISNIVGPIEKKVSKMVDIARADEILDIVKAFKSDIELHEQTDQYREMLNDLRKYDQELSAIHYNIEDTVISEFKTIQSELNALFSDQITKDDNTLNSFISGEIEEVEKAILNTHDLRQLEIILSTHPACLELMALLKQPFILESINKGKRFSPAMIQTRLHDKVEKRKESLLQQIKKQEQHKNAAKLQFAEMISESIIFFVKNHSGEWSDQELAANASHEAIMRDIRKLERDYNDVRLAQDLRRKLTRRILDRNRDDLEKMVAVEGKYAYIQNDPDLYVDLESSLFHIPEWDMVITEKKGEAGVYTISYQRANDLEIHKVTTDENLRSKKAFEIHEDVYPEFKEAYDVYIDSAFNYELLNALWLVHIDRNKASDFPQFSENEITTNLPKQLPHVKALRCALEKKRLEDNEKKRKRNVPKLSPEFIDETPFFQNKLREFVIKAKLQKMSGAGVILLSGPPSTGKSAFLKFASSIMNREYFEHTSDKWQTKNSLVTAIKFGEYGPYTIPAGFTKAITTPHSLINIEEIKEWPEALRKSLNPFFAGSKVFTAPDGTQYQIGENILLCAAANLGSMYRQNDEPFTADFWSRIEVVEYNYAPESVSYDYYNTLMDGVKHDQLTMQDLVREYFNYFEAPARPDEKAKYFARQFVEFSLLPKADEEIKRENLSKYINDYFAKDTTRKNTLNLYNPEEAIKVAFKRIKDFRSFDIKEFYDLYNHFNNNESLSSARLKKMQTADITKYNQLKIMFLIIRYLEGCFRELRELFYTSAGQTEIEGTNREFIKCIHLLSLMGKM